MKKYIVILILGLIVDNALSFSCEDGLHNLERIKLSGLDMDLKIINIKGRIDFYSKRYMFCEKKILSCKILKLNLLNEKQHLLFLEKEKILSYDNYALLEDQLYRKMKCNRP